ncbi:MAG: hypothetical protein V4501_00645 [Pseudomonadota bacterium]
MVKEPKNWPQKAADVDDSGSTGSLFDAEEGGTGASGGGQAGKIEFRFHDAMQVPSRDDNLPASEIRRLEFVHKDTHKEWVTKQKHTRAERSARKEGHPIRVPAQYQPGYGSGGGVSRYKKHPISDKFRGMADPQTNPVANLNDSQTNSELKEKLENQLRNRLQNTPKFNPRPRPV